MSNGNNKLLKPSSHQGVKQGGLGLLSAELYKLYIEDLLKTYENSKLG
jgi:hypothetical protein